MAKGKIKAGGGTLIGNAGEYYVVAELLKRSIVASLAPRNAPGFDVLATKGHFTVRIRVKTKSEAFDIWQWSVKKDGPIFKEISKNADFTILVNLTAQTCNLAFFVVPTTVLDRWLVADFERWLKTPGKKGQPHNATNTKRHLPYSRYAKELEQYRDAWDALWPRATDAPTA